MAYVAYVSEKNYGLFPSSVSSCPYLVLLLQYSNWRSGNWDINDRYERTEDNGTLAKRLVLKKLWETSSNRIEQKKAAVGRGEIFSDGQSSLACTGNQTDCKEPTEMFTNNGFPICGCVYCPAHVDKNCYWSRRSWSPFDTPAIVEEWGFLPCDLWGFPKGIFVIIFCCQTARWLRG